MLLKLRRGYYYLAPVWLLIETYAWPNLRAGLIVGHSGIGRVAFYALEGAIGLGLWRGASVAGQAALVENVALLIAAMRFVLFSPLDMAMEADSGTGKMAEMGAAYVQALPGVIASMFQVGHELYGRLSRAPLGVPPAA